MLLEGLTNRRCFGLLFTVLALAGCSAKQESEVCGTITVDGQLARSGYIGFYPTDEKSKASAGPIVDGKYTVAVPSGNQRVEIRVPKVVGIRKGAEVLVEALPAKFNSQTQLQLDVKPGSNSKNFDLKTN